MQFIASVELLSLIQPAINYIVITTTTRGFADTFRELLFSSSLLSRAISGCFISAHCCRCCCSFPFYVHINLSKTRNLLEHRQHHPAKCTMCISLSWNCKFKKVQYKMFGRLRLSTVSTHESSAFLSVSSLLLLYANCYMERRARTANVWRTALWPFIILFLGLFCHRRRSHTQRQWRMCHTKLRRNTLLGGSHCVCSL